jgi:hypothetical protein
MIDESTASSKKTVVMCIGNICPDSSEPSTFFSDLVELNNTYASAILGLMLSCFLKHGFTRECLLRNLISFAADGALRKKEGCLFTVAGNVPFELAVMDVVRETNEIDHTKSVFDKLYSLYSASPNN